MAKSRKKIKTYYDHAAKQRVFLPGSLVLVRIPVRPAEEAPGSKFYPRWRGPYKVLFSYDHGTNYRLEDCVTSTQHTDHVNNIKLYKKTVVARH